MLIREFPRSLLGKRLLSSVNRHRGRRGVQCLFESDAIPVYVYEMSDQFRLSDEWTIDYPTFVSKRTLLPHFEQGPKSDAAANQGKLLDAGLRGLFKYSARAVDSGL